MKKIDRDELKKFVEREKLTEKDIQKFLDSQIKKIIEKRDV